MRHCIGYLIAAVFFVGGYALSTIGWPATHDPPIPCGGHKTVWHESVPDRTGLTPPPIILPRLATDHSDGSPPEPRAGAGPAVAEPQRHFC